MKWAIVVATLTLWLVSLFYIMGLGALIGKHRPEMLKLPMSQASMVMNLFAGKFRPCGDKAALDCGFQNTTGRQEVSCSDYRGERTAVLMTFGQSNSGNSGDDPYIPATDVANFNFHDGKCYKAEDPLLGPDGKDGSVWGVLGDKLIVNGYYDKVLVIPFGIGGSAIEQWQPGELLHPILKEAARSTLEKGIEPTHVLWHQGEANAVGGTPEAEYFALFETLLGSLREYGITAPVYPAITTHCELDHIEIPPTYEGGRITVRAAQARLPELPGVFAGPDTDTIQGLIYRSDNCHFNAKGMQAHAKLWLDILAQGTR